MVGIVLRGMNVAQEEESLDELAFLADTAGAEVVDRVLQERRSIDPSTIIGKGKVQQVARLAEEQDANIIIFDLDLSPAQNKNLEKMINRKIIDRSGLILDIFAKRARTKEAQIQVELAQLEYLLPRLTRQWTHLSRQEGGIGTRGPGETQLEVDRRAIWKRIDHLKSELNRIEKQRSTRRKHRSGFMKTALVGYTNVGKSSLLNVLSGAEVFVEDRLFATLDTTVRVLPLESHRKVLLIDTVGFIRKLPHHLVASFRSTMAETVEADILLHIVDVSHSQFEVQMGSVISVLKEMNIEDRPILTVFNKIDRIDNPDLLQALSNRYPKAVFTSASKGMGLESLRRGLIALIEESEIEDTVRIPAADSECVAAIYRMSHVLEKTYEDNVALIRFRAKPEHVKRIHDMLDKRGNDACLNCG